MSGFPPALALLQADLERMRARKRRKGLRAAEALRRIREERGLSCAGLGRLIGVHHASVALWLKGGRPAPANARRLEEILGLPEAWWEDEPGEGDLS